MKEEEGEEQTQDIADVISSDSVKVDSGNNIENIDPKVVEEDVEDMREVDDETLVSRKEINFIKAVKQLQELEEGSTSCQHCGKKLSSRKALLEHEVNVHGDMTNADNYYRLVRTLLRSCEFSSGVTFVLRFSSAKL